MGKKYEILEEIKESKGVKVFRIRALKDFGLIKKGELGGFIESESNLSQEGNSWVDDEAIVFGDAVVSGDAIVSGNARVYGNSKIMGGVITDNAHVSNSTVKYGALIKNNAVVEDSVVEGGIYHNSKLKHCLVEFGSFIINKCEAVNRSFKRDEAYSMPSKLYYK